MQVRGDVLGHGQEEIPRLHLIRFHGVLAPNAGLRAAIVPGPAQNVSVPADEHAAGVQARMGWARLLKRVFIWTSNTARSAADSGVEWSSSAGNLTKHHAINRFSAW